MFLYMQNTHKMVYSKGVFDTLPPVSGKWDKESEEKSL